jgi:hypothetical protein
VLAIWRAYLEILNERIFLVDRWSDGIATWHPRFVQKLCWYSGIPATKRNPNAAYRWLVKNCTKIVRESHPKCAGYLTPLDEELLSVTRTHTQE